MGLVCAEKGVKIVHLAYELGEGFIDRSTDHTQTHSNIRCGTNSFTILNFFPIRRKRTVSIKHFKHTSRVLCSIRQRCSLIKYNNNDHDMDIDDNKQNEI